MPAYKDTARGSWYVKFKYKNWRNETKWVTKRGFNTKREASQWELDYHKRKEGNLDMTFADFVEVYRQDRKPRIKESTCVMKDNIIDTKLVPYFGQKHLRDITSKDVIQWQNEMLIYRNPETGKPFSKSYLKTIHNQELICKGWFLPPNTYDCGSFVVNGTAVIGKKLNHLNNS